MPFGEQFVLSEERLKWISELKEGDEIDTIKEEKQFNNKIWSKAAVLEKSNDYIKVTFHNELSNFDRYIHLKSR